VRKIRARKNFHAGWILMHLEIGVDLDAFVEVDLLLSFGLGVSIQARDMWLRYTSRGRLVRIYVLRLGWNRLVMHPHI
jgi:hypothetical protein